MGGKYRKTAMDMLMAGQMRKDGRSHTAAYLEKYGGASLPWTQGGPERIEEMCRRRLEADAPMAPASELTDGAVL